MIDTPTEPRDREEARKLLRDAEKTIRWARYRSVNPVPHEKKAKELRQKWLFF